MAEYVLYHAYHSEPHGYALVADKLTKRVASPLSKLLFKISALTFVLGSIILAVYFLPPALYSAFSDENAAKTSQVIAQTVAGGQPILKKEASQYQPRLDPKLSTGTTLRIPSIGVETGLQEATFENYEDALKAGVWRVSDFGTPHDREEPTILAAHRYGYISWTNAFRKKNSFYNLPKLSVGDTVEITFRQRKYVYAVYAEGKGDKITDYSADLILYTCENLNSPVRIFKYAKLLEI